jgi:hypothetical protein
MNGYAIISDGRVLNIIAWNGVDPWTPPDGTDVVLLAPGEWVDIGATFDANAVPRFAPATPDEPVEI